MADCLTGDFQVLSLFWFLWHKKLHTKQNILAYLEVHVSIAAVLLLGQIRTFVCATGTGCNSCVLGLPLMRLNPPSESRIIFPRNLIYRAHKILKAPMRIVHNCNGPTHSWRNGYHNNFKKEFKGKTLEMYIHKY